MEHTHHPDVGKIIKFGNYEWLILDVQDNKALIITRYLCWKEEYNKKYQDVTWETCTLRKYLNSEFLQKFTAEEQKKIIETEINNPDNLWYGTSGGNNTIDKVFLLGIEEIEKYFGGNDYTEIRRKDLKVKRDYYKIGCEYEYTDDASGCWLSDDYNIDRIAAGKSFESESWWLRTPGDAKRAVSVGANGDIDIKGSDVSRSYFSCPNYRPALWLNGYSELLETGKVLSEEYAIERKLRHKFPQIAEYCCWHSEGYVYFKYSETKKVPYNDDFEIWKEYRTKADGSGELELVSKSN